MVLIECMLPFFLVFEGRRPKARELVLLAALCALGVAGRAAFFMLPQCKPVTALSIIAGAAFGGETGFLVGAVSMLVSNMLFGQGPWTPWQMFTMGLIGFVASLLFHSGLLRRTRWTMALFGFVAVLALYGGIMNPASALILYGTQVTGKTLLTYYLTGLPMDCVHAATTALFLFVAAEPLLDTFQRIRGKYGLVELHGNLHAKNSLV
ncbi:MAG: ECF transporter S component [Oscillospiraceae bacterium]|nr:ECF transporter S component [Oscillospiraceae bacterium]